jgi:hypothetical protein
MVDAYTRGGIRRKRPEPGEEYAAEQRLERQDRLRVPLRARILDEELHGYGDEELMALQAEVRGLATKADIRELERDVRREKNASIRDRENEAYEVRRERVLEAWGNKVERQERRARGKAIIEARKDREQLRNALLDGERLEPEMPDPLSPESERAMARAKRSAANTPTKHIPLAQQAEEEGIEHVLPPKFRERVCEEPSNRARQMKTRKRQPSASPMMNEANVVAGEELQARMFNTGATWHPLDGEQVNSKSHRWHVRRSAKDILPADTASVNTDGVCVKAPPSPRR